MDNKPWQLVALSFEAGGDASVAASILDVLRDTKTQATVFLLGEWAFDHATLVRQMAAEGHELGNHTYHHPDLTKLNDEQVLDELARTKDLALCLSGQPAFPWLRPPFGSCDQRVRRVAEGEGYQLAIKLALDGTSWPDATTPETIVQRTLDAASDGAVLTYHLNQPMTLTVLPEIITSLRTAGFGPTTLSALQAAKGQIDWR